jgi:hypothetical protein
MTRTSSILILVLAMLGATTATAAAAGPDGYETVTAITGGSGDNGQAQSSGHDSVNALVGSGSSDRSGATSSPAEPNSLNATLGANGLAQESPTAVVGATGGDGFDWSDAVVGASIAFGLALMTLAGARLVVRHRRATVEGRA